MAKSKKKINPRPRTRWSGKVRIDAQGRIVPQPDSPLAIAIQRYARAHTGPKALELFPVSVDDYCGSPPPPPDPNMICFCEFILDMRLGIIP